MSITLTASEQQTVQIATQFAQEQVAPAAAQWESQRSYPRSTLVAAAQAGLTGLLVAEEHGGKGLSCTAMARVVEELASADMAFAFALVVHNNLMGNIAKNGTQAQRDRYLPALMSMDRIGAFLLTEPQVGSDAAALHTKARHDGDGWVIDGAKAWVSNASAAQTLSVYAQTDEAAGWRGIACFLVDADAPGVVREPAYELLGGHALGAGGFRFEACRIADANVLIPAGQGFKAAMAGIDIARASVAAMCSGMLRTCLNTALQYMNEREAFGQKIGQFQGLQWQLADVATDRHAARLMAYAASAKIDAGEDAAVDAAHAKKFATRAALRGISECMQVMGANGLKHEHPFARHLSCAKIAQYLDGTTEIQNVVISRALERALIA